MAGGSSAKESHVVVGGIADAADSVKIGMENQQQKEEQHEQSSGNREQQEKNKRNRVLPS